MEAAEQSDDLVQFFIYFFASKTSNILGHYLVTVFGDIVWYVWIKIHKFLEGLVTGLLELNIRVEGVIDQVVNLFLKIKELLNQLFWFFVELFFIDILRAGFSDVIPQAEDDLAKICLLSDKALVHEFKFIIFLLFNHVLATSGLLNDRLGVFTDNLLLNTLHQLWLSFWLQHVFAIVFLMGKPFVCQVKIVRCRTVINQFLRLDSVLFLRCGQEV